MQTLLIDDDPFAIRMLALQLEQLGWTEVVNCESAEQALARLETTCASTGLIFCDLQMPEIDGVEFVRHLDRIGYRGALVLVSGEHERILQTAQKLAQAHHIHLLGALSKPVTLAQLRQVLASNALQRNSATRAVRRSYEPEELKRAIAGGELVNHYQPKVELATGVLIGVEALVRWQHPQSGLMYPDEFIATAEEFGLIDDLTQAVLTAALNQARVWRAGGLDLNMAVNVSMDNLAALDFPDVVARLVEEAGVAPSSVTMEVTESQLMKDVRAPLEILTRLRLKRIGLSIDDFGTGHSSLAQLRDLPFNELKLDRSFISGAVNDPALRAIVEATLGMAHQLGMKAVAEGVEGRDDWDFLRALGCDVAQGYFIAKPMPGSDLLGWSAAWEQRRAGLHGTAA